MRKKILSLILIVSMSIPLCACGKVDEVSQKVMNDIDSIGDVSLDDAALIEKTMQTYSTLTDAQKKQVKNYVKLLEAQEEIEKLQAAKSDEIKESLKSAVADIYASALICEEIITDIKMVWDEDIDYVKVIFYSDDDYEWYASLYSTIGTWYSVKENVDNVRNLLPKLEEANDTVLTDNKALTEWPSDMSETKAIYADFYDAYLKLYECASSPSGNYINYCSDTNTCIDEFITQYKKLEPYL